MIDTHNMLQRISKRMEQQDGIGRHARRRRTFPRSLLQQYSCMLIGVLMMTIAIQVVQQQQHHLMFVAAQSHSNFRTCSLKYSEPLLLYYDTVQGMYVRYDNNQTTSTGSNVSNTTPTNVTAEQNETSTRVRTFHRRRLVDRTRSSNNENENQYSKHTLKAESTRKPIDSSSSTSWYSTLLFKLVSWHQYLTSNLDSEPAIAMYSNTQQKLSQQQQRRRKVAAATLGSISSSNTGEGTQIRANPNIQFYPPPQSAVDGGSSTSSNNSNIITVRNCECSNLYNWSKFTYYCPMDKTYCYIPVVYSSISPSTFETYPYYLHPLCIPTPTYRAYFARYMKFIGFSMLAFLIVMLIVSPKGHHAIRYCCIHCVPCCCWHYNQKYVDYMIENKPKLTKYYLERYINHMDREERFNARYIELQRVHGEMVSNTASGDDETGTTNITENGIQTGPTSTIGTGTISASPTVKDVPRPLNELEESIVSDLYYYRLSLVLKTRIYDGSGLEIQSETLPLNSVNCNNSETRSSESSPPATVSHLYDTDMLIIDDTNVNETGATDNLNKNVMNADTTGCMICYEAIEIGTKIGVLPNCHHTFHTECLKDWLKRRNVCPLCLDTDVATVAFSRKSVFETGR
jgi:Ring finger domain